MTPPFAAGRVVALPAGHRLVAMADPGCRWECLSDAVWLGTALRLHLVDASTRPSSSGEEMTTIYGLIANSVGIALTGLNSMSR